MRFTLEMTMKNSEGVLERILGRLRQRNFNIQAMTVNCSTDETEIEAKITLSSSKNADSIMKQLGKLYDVQSMEVYYSDEEKNLAYMGEQNEVCLSV